MTPEDTDDDVMAWARETWPDATGTLTIAPFARGAALTHRDGKTAQILIAIDHPDARALIERVLRAGHIAREVHRLSLMPVDEALSQPRQPVTRLAGKVVPYRHPTTPAVPQPYMQSPSAPPPSHEDLHAAVDFAAHVSQPPTSTPTSSDDDVSPRAAPVDLDPGGGDSGGAGASSDWGSSDTSSSSSDSGSSDSGGGGSSD